VTHASLDRLLDAAAIQPLLDAAARLIPAATIGVEDTDGAVVAAAGPGRDVNASEVSSEMRRPIAAAGEPVGVVVVTGSVAERTALDAAASTVAAALTLAATEAAGRRAVSAAALVDLRELSLLSRLAETIGSAVDPDRIAGCVLDVIARPLRAEVAAVLPVGGGRPVASIGDADGVARLVAEADPILERLRSADPDQGACADLGEPGPADAFGSILAAVVRTTRGPQGAIVLGRAHEAKPFDDPDRRLLAAVASQTAVALERATLQREILGRRSLDDELAIGRRIQRSLMPRRFPHLPGWEIAAAYESAREIGGDLFDTFLLRDQPGRLAFAIADVTGKGIPAAILMADARALIHAAADHSTGPAESLSRVNRVLVRERATSLFVTVAHGVIDGATGVLRLANAGHDPVHVLRADGSLEALEPTGRMIGMVDEIGVGTDELTIRPGDVLVAHTDGVTEARSPDGSFYGEERYTALLRSLAGRSASEIVGAVTADVETYRDGAEASDDLTLLVIRRLPESPGLLPG
jgi:serine phosphatase RsbU (regulator of sigma subunit)